MIIGLFILLGLIQIPEPPKPRVPQSNIYAQILCRRLELPPSDYRCPLGNYYFWFTPPDKFEESVPPGVFEEWWK